MLIQTVFFSYDRIKPLIAQTDKFLFDIKGSGQGLVSLCFAQASSNDNAERAFDNLRRLLALHKIEEVRLVCITGFYNIEETLRRIAELVRDYSDVLLKLIRVHTRGTGNQKSLRVNVPHKARLYELEEFVRSLGVKNIHIIL